MTLPVPLMIGSETLMTAQINKDCLTTGFFPRIAAEAETTLTNVCGKPCHLVLQTGLKYHRNHSV